MLALVQDQRGELSIAQFLGAITTERMGLNGNPEADLAVGREVIDDGLQVFEHA